MIWYLFGRFEEQQLEQAGFGEARQAANLEVGDVVELWVDYDPDRIPLFAGLDCLSRVTDIALRSTAPDIVKVEPRDRDHGVLTALAPGTASIDVRIHLLPNVTVTANLYQFDRRFLPLRIIRVR